MLRAHVQNKKIKLTVLSILNVLAPNKLKWSWKKLHAFKNDAKGIKRDKYDFEFDFEFKCEVFPFFAIQRRARAIPKSKKL